MNKIETVPAVIGRHSYLEIEVDGKLLANHFVGRQGSNPSCISPLGWVSASVDYRAELVAQFLARRPSGLASGRVPVLVCEECGEIGCGGIAVRVIRESDQIIWTDWLYEDGIEEGSSIGWPTKPGDLVFEIRAYEEAINRAL